MSEEPSNYARANDQSSVVLMKIYFFPHPYLLSCELNAGRVCIFIMD